MAKLANGRPQGIRLARGKQSAGGKNNSDVIKKSKTVKSSEIQIPTSFKMFSRKFEVVYDPKLMTMFQTNSFTEYHAGRVVLAPSTETYNRTQVDIYCNYLQEVVRIFFMFGQDEEAKEDFQFITLFSNCLHQAIISSRYEKPAKDDYKFTRIPNSFQIFGKTFDVQDSRTILYNNHAVGMAEYPKQMISLHMSDDSLEHASDDEYHTFMHELVHIIFSSLGEMEKNENETLVNLLAACLAQSFVTAEY